MLQSFKSVCAWHAIGFLLSCAVRELVGTVAVLSWVTSVAANLPTEQLARTSDRSSTA